MPKIEKSLWCSSPEHFVSYKNAETDTDRAQIITILDNGLDMETCGWIPVGTATVDMRFDSVENGMASAIAACDLAEQELRSKLNEQLAAIDSIRQNLLALPAPKAKEEDDDIPF